VKNQNNSSRNVKYQCIYCLRTDLETSFTIEHIIPASLKGFLVLENHVCDDCNSWLGRNVDYQILRVPEITDGFSRLGYDKEHQKTIKYHYDITAELREGLVVKYGRYVKGEIVFPTQDLPDGSSIVPESSAFDTLLKKSKRDERVKTFRFTDEQIEANFKRFWSKYEKSKVGQRLISNDLGIDLIKRSSQPKLTIEPKQKANVLPLIGKIAYEFYFFISGGKFFNKENDDLRSGLGSLIRGEFREKEKLPNDMFFMREKPISDDYQKHHLIRLDFAEKIWVQHVSFFGHVQYLLTTNALSNDILESLIRGSKVEDLKFIVLKLKFDTNKLLLGFGTSKGFIPGGVMKREGGAAEEAGG